MRLNTIANGWLAILFAICTLTANSANAQTTETELQKIKVLGLEISYDSQTVSDDEIKRLSEFLEKRGYATDDPYTMEVRKQESTWQLLVIASRPERLKDQSMIDLTAQFAQDISTRVFESATVEFHICDDKLRPIRIIRGKTVFGTLHTMSGMDVYVDTPRVSKKEATNFVLFVSQNVEKGFSAFVLTKRNNSLVMKQFVNEYYKTDVEFFNDIVKLVELTPQALEGQQLVIELCDQGLQVLATVPGWSGPPRQRNLDDYEKLIFDQVDLYYDQSTVEKKQAERLGSFMQTIGMSSAEFTISLDHRDQVWQIGMLFPAELIDNEDFVNLIRHVGFELSLGAFDQGVVEMHLLDPGLTPRRIVKAKSMLGEQWIIENGTTIFFDEGFVSEDEAADFAGYLEEIGLTDGSPKSFRLHKTNGDWQVHLIANEDVIHDPGAINDLQKLAQQISRDVFGGASVEFFLLDELLKTQKRVSYSGLSLDN